MEEKTNEIPAKQKKHHQKPVLLMIAIPVILIISFTVLLTESFVLDIAKVKDELSTSVNRIVKSFDEIIADREVYAEDFDRRMLNRVRFAAEYAFPEGIRDREDEFEEILNSDIYLVIDRRGEIIYSNREREELNLDDRALARCAHQCWISTEPHIYDVGGTPAAMWRNMNGDILCILENTEIRNFFMEEVGTPDAVVEGASTENSFSAVTNEDEIVYAGSLLQEHIGELYGDVVKSTEYARMAEDVDFPEICSVGGKLYLHMSREAGTEGYTVHYFVDLLRTILHSSHAVILMFIFILLYIGILVFYLYQHRKEPEINTEDGRRNYRVRAMIGSSIVLLLVYFTAYYCRTLFCLANYVMDDQDEIEEVVTSLESGKASSDTLDALYDYLFGIDTEMIGDWVEHSAHLPDRKTLTKISELLDIKYIALFDKEGKFLVSSGDYINLALSENKEDASYELRSLMLGVPEVTIRDKYDDMTFQDVRINAFCLRDQDLVPDGFVVGGFDSALQREAKNRSSLNELLDSARISALNTYYVIDPETSIVTYATDHSLVGIRAQDIGLNELNLNDHFSGEITLNQIPSYATSGNVEGKYLYVSLPNDIVFGSRFIFAVHASMAVFTVLVLFQFLLRTIQPDEGSAQENERYVAVKTDEFTTKMAVSALERLSLHIDWNALNPEEKTGLFIRIVMFVMFALIGITAVIHPEIYTSSPVLMYLLEGKWTPGINVYAFTAILIMVLVVTIIVTAIRELLMIISGVLTPKMETVCRLLRSFLEYASVLGTVYAALVMLGMDVTSLVASAGIMTLIVGLGAEDMVADLVSGLFLIFESEFQVGDRIVVKGKTGQVREIGILSTKMVDENNNIFIVNNKEVSDVLNQTVRSSLTLLSFQLPSTIPIGKVQEVFARELPPLRDKYPDLLSEPRLRGIRNFRNGKMDCQIICEVQESRRYALTCGMNREIMRIIEILKNEEGKEGTA